MFVHPLVVLLGVAGTAVLLVTACLIAAMVLTRISIRSVREQMRENIHLPERPHRQKRQGRIDPHHLEVDNDSIPPMEEDAPEEKPRKKGLFKFFSVEEDEAPEEPPVHRLGESDRDIEYLPYDLQNRGEGPSIHRIAPEEDEHLVFQRPAPRKAGRPPEPDDVPVEAPEAPAYSSTAPQEEKRAYRKPPISMSVSYTHLFHALKDLGPAKDFHGIIAISVELPDGIPVKDISSFLQLIEFHHVLLQRNRAPEILKLHKRQLQHLTALADQPRQLGRFWPHASDPIHI